MLHVLASHHQPLSCRDTDKGAVTTRRARQNAWLDPNLTDKDEAQRLITGIEYEPLQVRAVSTAVTRPAAAPPRDPN
jgi:putative SOS response-associated peptidase YedK